MNGIYNAAGSEFIRLIFSFLCAVHPNGEAGHPKSYFTMGVLARDIAEQPIQDKNGGNFGGKQLKKDEHF